MSILTDTTFYAQTKIQMINQCLLAIGEVVLPEGTLIEDLPIGTDARTAEFYVVKVMKQIQNIGWFFNMDYSFKFVPDEDEFITAPANLLRIDPGLTVNRSRIIKKGARFYDLYNQSYKFEADVYADAIWLVDYSELPVSAFDYIAMRAARQFQQSVIGSTELANFTTNDELDLLVSLQREHLQYRDFNMLGRGATRLTNPKSSLGYGG